MRVTSDKSVFSITTELKWSRNVSQSRKSPLNFGRLILGRDGVILVPCDDDVLWDEVSILLSVAGISFAWASVMKSNASKYASSQSKKWSAVKYSSFSRNSFVEEWRSFTWVASHCANFVFTNAIRCWMTGTVNFALAVFLKFTKARSIEYTISFCCSRSFSIVSVT